MFLRSHERSVPVGQNLVGFEMIMAAFKRWRSKYKRYKNQIPDQMRNRIILHYGLFKITWDWVILILVLYTAIEVPFVSAFVLARDDEGKHAAEDASLDFFETLRRRYPEAYPLLYTDLIIDFLFMIDILMNFRTTYVKEGEVLITGPWKIAVHYLKTYFVVDFVAAIPWDLLASFNSGTEENTMLFSLLKTARLLRLFRAARKLDRNYEYMTSLLFLMIMFFMLVAHWLACIWYAIGAKEAVEYDGLSWLSILGYQMELPIMEGEATSGPTLRTRYLTSLYYVMTLCTTVGFGNVSANTDGERIFSICCMLMGAVMHAAIFGNVTAIIHGQYSSNFRYRKESLQINEFVRYFKIKNPLARRLRDYSRHTWSQTKGTDMAKVLKKFPDGLQYEIHLHMHLTVLSDSFLFHDFDDSCLKALSKTMHRHHHLPGHQILHEGDDIDSVHLVRRGKIDIMMFNEPRGKIREGDAYGASLRQISSRPRAVVSLRASTCVDCHVIKLKDLEDVMTSYPNLRAQLLSMMDAADQNDLYEEGVTHGNGNGDGYDPDKNGSGFHVKLGANRKHQCTHKKNRLIVDHEYEMKPMLGVRSSKLLEQKPSHSSKEKLGNGDLNKYKSVSMEDNSSGELNGRFINVTQLADIEIESPDDVNENFRTTEEVVKRDDVCDEDFAEEAPQHMIDTAKSTCSHCQTEFRPSENADFEERFQEMASNMQRLESRMETLISLLERSESGKTPLKEAASAGRERMTSV
ncbi:potassium voltage-gated channel subfamily H member 7-like isoform X4 [Orbicella faveolata]|uniref:potassium voltage-gated channel subfamily H member 7-like isoform X4 n=1 Tax=Orbicella faveolata TaxID=48498 RepID=UPI0009E63FA5|nr:potassium voltage-gated channel subfamily H member 7-like isoform X4 [Orbicella faveolata]